MMIDGYNRLAVIKQGIYDKKYYYALYDDDIQIGDEVLVSGKATGVLYKIDDIIENVLDDSEQNTLPSVTQEVICKVDTSEYNKRVKCRKEMQYLKNKMKKLRSKIREEQDDAFFASISPEYATLMEELHKKIDTFEK